MATIKFNNDRIAPGPFTPSQTLPLASDLHATPTNLLASSAEDCSFETLVSALPSFPVAVLVLNSPNGGSILKNTALTRLRKTSPQSPSDDEYTTRTFHLIQSTFYKNSPIQLDVSTIHQGRQSSRFSKTPPISRQLKRPARRGITIPRPNHLRLTSTELATLGPT